MIKYKAKLYTFEGADGLGKTTALNSVIEELNNKTELENYNIIRKHLPDMEDEKYATISNFVRSKYNELSPATRLAYMGCALSDYFNSVINPLLEDSKNIIILDRSHISTRVYQHTGNGVDTTKILFYIDPLLVNYSIFNKIFLFYADRPFKTEIDDEFEKIGTFKEINSRYMNIFKKSKYNVSFVNKNHLNEKQTVDWIMNDIMKDILNH